MLQERQLSLKIVRLNEKTKKREHNPQEKRDTSRIECH